jgi:glucan phosphoethanolaminetransferase (alkaline phosphatase superfamily)
MLSLVALVEPSKVPWFIAGGVLAAWAVVLSAIGLTQPDFPKNEGVTRLVILVSVVLVVAAMTSAVATS